MPRAGDAYLVGPIPQTHNPLHRMNPEIPRLQVDVEAFIEQWKQFFDEYLLDIIFQVTGLDLRSLRDFFDGIDFTLGTFDPVAALEQFAENINATGVITALDQLFRDAVAGIPGATIPDVEDRLQFLTTGTGLFDSSALNNIGNIPQISIGRVVDTATDSVQDFFDFMFGSLTGQTSVGAAATNVSDQTGEMSATLAAHGAMLDQLISQRTGGGNSGLFSSDDFERTAATDLGGTTFWTQTYSGSGTNVLAIPNGHDAAWVQNVTTDRRCIARRTATADQTAQTDYIVVSMVITSPVITPTWWGANDSFNDLYNRMNSAGTHYVRAKITHNEASLFYAAGGAESQLGSTVSTTQAIGVKFDLVCGTAGGLRVFQIKKNGAIIFSHTDSGALTSAGATFRGWGFGMGGGDQVPSAITNVTIADNTATSTVGCGARIYRSSTSGVAVSTATTNGVLLPTNVFDATERKTNDITVDTTNGKLTVSIEGWYHVVLRAQASATLRSTNASAGNQHITPLLYKNGSINQRGTTVSVALDGLSNELGVDAICSSFLVYLVAGDYVQGGHRNQAAGMLSRNWIGDAGGVGTFLSIGLVNRSQL